MNRRTRWIIGLALAAALAAGGAAMLRTKKPQPPPNAAAAVSTIELLSSDLVAAAPRALQTTLPITGTLKPVNQTVVKTKVAGELSAVLVREGESVQAGQVVARIDPTEFEWRVKQRQAALASAQASFDMAQKTRENNQALLAKGFISQTAFDQAHSQSAVARANVDAAVAELTLAKKALNDSVLRAPLSGMVAERHAQAGEKLAVDGRVLTLVDLSRMEIEAPVPAERIGGVSIGQAVTLTVEGTQQALQGKILRINPATTPGTRSIMVYIGVDNPGGAARGGVFAEGRLLLAARQAAVAVPASSVREENGSPGVYVLKDGRIAHRSVATGMQAVGPDQQPWVEITQGLAAGEQVIRQNTAQFRDGMAARITPGKA